MDEGVRTLALATLDLIVKSEIVLEELHAKQGDLEVLLGSLDDLQKKENPS